MFNINTVVHSDDKALVDIMIKFCHGVAGKLFDVGKGTLSLSSF